MKQSTHSAVFWLHSREQCRFSLYWFRVTLLTNLDFFPCLCAKFHECVGSLFWVPISQKVRSLFQNLGVPISFGDSGVGFTVLVNFFVGGASLNQSM